MTRPKKRISIVLNGIYIFFIAWLIANDATAAPLLWRVDGLRPNYFCGTVHSSDPRAKTILPPALSALDRCQSFHPEVELSPELASRMAERMFSTGTPELETRLRAPLWERVRAAGAKLGLPELLLQRLSPGLAALLFAVPPEEADLSATIDGQLYEHSQARGLRISALETIDEQLDLFDKLAPAEAQALLAESLDDFEAGYPQLGRLLDAYASGDERRIAAEVEAEFKDPSVRELAGPLLYRRNEIMAARVEPHLKRGGAFVAVGVAHLVGPRSVIALLRAKGFKITRMQPQAR
ncbi:MAG TPA: TraB/GumN family protein [Opitutaceae bacterium]|nr:TraB/GumN family protein [Opitutaceae bacterium]